MIDRRVACLGLTLGCLLGRSGRVRAEMSNEQYAEALKQRLEQVAKTQKLRDHKVPGMTLISFQIRADGSLKWREATQGGGSDLARLALAVVGAAAPFPPLPKSMEDHVWVWLLSLDANLSMVEGAGPNGP